MALHCAGSKIASIVKLLGEKHSKMRHPVIRFKPCTGITKLSNNLKLFDNLIMQQTKTTNIL
jgi:hypothetical protein